MSIALAEPTARTKPVGVTPKMLAAGRTTFRRERDNLSDLYEFFESDLDEFLTRIYSSMTRARA